MEFIEEHIVPHANYWVYILMMMIGLWAMISKNNLIKKLIGMSIFQTAIILFYVSVGVKEGSTIPIQDPGLVTKHYEAGLKKLDGDPAPLEEVKNAEETKIDPNNYANPLPHVLMLTAIVVGVATLGVALAITQLLYRDFESIEESEILEKIKASPHDF